jgi:sigma-B regulation protein RsbU (phosphoserine phosphatase)
MTPQSSLILPNDVDTIPQLNEYIDCICEENGIDMEIAMSLNLAIEEAVVNVMSYAYPDGAQGEVKIESAVDPNQITFVITDNGIPFDPTAKEDVDVTLSAEERPIGGLGIHLIRQIMTHISYERKDGKNILTLSKDTNK